MKAFGAGNSAWDKIRAEKAAKTERRIENAILASFTAVMMTLGAVAAELTHVTRISCQQPPETQTHSKSQQAARPQNVAKKVASKALEN